jgi:hypothetical protein
MGQRVGRVRGAARILLTISAIVVSTGFTRCARRQTQPEHPESQSSTLEQIGCDGATPSKQQCAAYQGTGFVEAYVDFFYATATELEIAFPLGVSPSTPYGQDPPAPSERSMQRAYQMRETLSWLSCFSITEQELESLGDAFGLPAPPPARHVTPEQVAAFIERLTGKPVAVSKLRQRPTRGPHLIAARYFPGGCGMIHQIPPSFVDRLAAERDPATLGRKWVAAIIAGGPNPAAIYDENADDAARQDPRNDPLAWSSIARDLVDLVRRNDCGNRKLYVQIWFDC